MTTIADLRGGGGGSKFMTESLLATLPDTPSLYRNEYYPINLTPSDLSLFFTR